SGHPLYANDEVLTPTGTLLAAHYSALLLSSDRACSFTSSKAVPTDKAGPADVLLDASDADRHVWIAVDDTIYRSTDAGVSAAPVHTFAGAAFLSGGGAASPVTPGVLY